jgi:hypothetical protein
MMYYSLQSIILVAKISVYRHTVDVDGREG